MTIGLILLGITAILIFFGLAQRFFTNAGIKSWLAFIIVLALVVGAVVPSIKIGGFAMNIGGFIVPLIAMIVFMALMHRDEVFKTLIAIVAVASVAVATRMLIAPVNGGLIMAASLIIGFVGGATAFLAGQSRLATLAAAFGGIVLGDVIVNFLNVFALKNDIAFSLGTYGVFDSVILAAAFGALLCQAVLAIKRLNSHRRIAGSALSAEAAEDTATAQKDTEAAEDSTEGLVCPAVKTKSAKTKSVKSKAQHELKETETDDFFDDFV